ncbi:MAG: hypothetical protein EBT15_11375 [Betaproteobacteria bacterium]|nr:hypothetical protein [Betaproteobacteria bacterium]
MTTITITIADGEDGTIEAEAKLDDNNVLDQPPTAALIVGSYLGANFEQIAKDAFAWFNQSVKQ